MGYYDRVLEHHGILGQKWGVRRFENKGGHLTAAGKKRYDTDEDGNYKKLNSSSKSSGTSSEGEKKKGLTDEQKAKLKKAAIIGGVAVGTALAAYGAYKISESHKEKVTAEAFRKMPKIDDRPIITSKEIGRAKDLLSSGKISETTRSNIQDALKEVESKTGNVGKSIADSNAYKDAAQLLKYENDIADWHNSNKGNLKSVDKFKLAAERVKEVSEANKKMAETASSSKSSRPKPPPIPTKFTYTKFEPTKFSYEKFDAVSKANDDLVSDLLKKNAKMLASVGY